MKDIDTLVDEICIAKKQYARAVIPPANKTQGHRGDLMRSN